MFHPMEKLQFLPISWGRWEAAQKSPRAEALQRANPQTLPPSSPSKSPQAFSSWGVLAPENSTPKVIPAV